MRRFLQERPPRRSPARASARVSAAPAAAQTCAVPVSTRLQLRHDIRPRTTGILAMTFAIDRLRRMESVPRIPSISNVKSLPPRDAWPGGRHGPILGAQFDHQPVGIRKLRSSHRRGLRQVQHNPRHVRLGFRHANLAHQRVAHRDVMGAVARAARQIRASAVDVEEHALRVGEMVVLKCEIGRDFDGDAGHIAQGPEADRGDFAGIERGRQRRTLPSSRTRRRLTSSGEFLSYSCAVLRTNLPS